MNTKELPLLSKKVLLLAPILFVLFFIVINFILRQFRHNIVFSLAPYWPISIFSPKLPMLVDCITILAILIFGLSLQKHNKAKKPFWQRIIIVWFIVLATNLLQGVQGGFTTPTDSGDNDGFDYWQDTLIIHNPVNIWEHYVTIQPTLGYHSRVHPPLALFLYYYLRLMFHEPWLVSIVISLISISSLYFYKSWLSNYTSKTAAENTAILIGLAPAFQIYSLASIDAIIATFFIATIYLFDRKGQNPHYQAVITLIASMLLTFGAIWLIALLIGMDILKNHNIRSVSKLLVSVGIFFILLYLITGYSYIASFITAASFEGTKNFFQSPITFFSYCLSRIQDILEPAVFLGPFLLLLLYRSLKDLTYPLQYDLRLISLGALGLFCAFLSTGAYYTGETARAALYIIMPIIAPIALYLDKRGKENDFMIMSTLILSQTILMQLYGNYFW